MARPISHERLAQVAFLYYVQGQEQSEVARRLGTSRSNVSRLLRAAREQGVIRFEINYPTRRDFGLEERLYRRFQDRGLREAIVTSSALAGSAGDTGGHTATLATAEGAAEWLDANLEDGQVIALFWGGTVRAMVDVARFSRQRDVHVVQMAGEWSNDPRRSGHDLVRDLAVKIGGRYTYFNAPAFAATAADADALMAEPQVAASLALANSADICVVGVGRFLAETTAMFLEQANAREEEIAEAMDKNVVGQLAGRFFDAEGRQPELAVHRRLLSLDLEDVRGSKTILVLATGAAKRQAVAAALQGGLVDVLVCDSELGRALLETEGPTRPG